MPSAAKPSIGEIHVKDAQPASPTRQAIALLTKPHMLARIQQLQGERNERVRVDADWVLRRLFEELTADVNDILNPDGSVKPVCDWPKIWRTGLRPAPW